MRVECSCGEDMEPLGSVSSNMVYFYRCLNDDCSNSNLILEICWHTAELVEGEIEDFSFLPPQDQKQAREEARLIENISFVHSSVQNEIERVLAM